MGLFLGQFIESTAMALLTERNIQQFKESGFTQVDAFWSPNELSAIRGALEDLQQQGKLNNVATEGDGVTPTKAASNLQLCPLIPEHPLFACLPWVGKVHDAVAALLQEDVTAILAKHFGSPLCRASAHRGIKTTPTLDFLMADVEQPCGRQSTMPT